MNKLLAQSGLLLLLCAAFLAGCSKEGSIPAEAERDAFFEALPKGLPVFIDIDEPFVSDSAEDPGKVALYSYQLPETAQDSAVINEILSADSRLIISLNTEPDTKGQSEITLLARNDSVYIINHQTSQVRLLSHFTQRVCELLPVERVEPNSAGSDTRLTVLHADFIYVMTSEGVGANACQGEGKKRFYALPFDFQLDPTQAEDGKLHSLESVSESLARAKLLFGWVNDPEQVGFQKLTHGYLGYATDEQKLAFYNADRELVWQQDRQLEKFPVVSVMPEKSSPAFLFYVQELANQHYLIQLGLDVFVVDSSAEIFAKGFNETDSILTDRVLKASLSTVESTINEFEYVRPVELVFDDQDLLVIDAHKLFYLDYQANTLPRNPSSNFVVVAQNATNIASRDFTNKRYFSQFDLKACGDDATCLAAHNIEAQSWQFMTPCAPALGCALNDQVDDFCETAAEKLITQSDEPFCSASDYRHLSELNDPANDMQFRGFMQYASDYIRSLVYVLENKRLYVTARMHQKDVLLRYNYALDFDAAKSVREQVLFGKRASLFGMDANFVDNHLYLTTLSQSAVRSNECYKNYVRVDCDLGNDFDTGGQTACSALDLQEGKCTNKFIEYESRALLCTPAQLTNQSCSDDDLAQIDALAVESAQEDAKWLKLFDYQAPTSPAHRMLLLVGDHSQALQSKVLDEGRLLNPEIYSFDPLTGQSQLPEGVLDGVIEQAVSGWFVKDPGQGAVEVLAHIQVISEDLVTLATASRPSTTLVSYLLEQSFADPNAQSADQLRATKVGESSYIRP